MPNWLIGLAIGVLDRAGALTKQECLSYGGHLGNHRARLCKKWRWHTDSHAYEWVDR